MIGYKILPALFIIHLFYSTPIYSMTVKPYSSTKFESVDKQVSEYTCGLAVLSTLFQDFFNLDIDQNSMYDKYITNIIMEKRGITFLHMKRIANDFGFDDLAISVKSSNVYLMIEAYRLLSTRTDYPLHLGVTEAGSFISGTVKSSVGIGTLLSEGIGDTIRVSLTDEPEKEVVIGKEILRSLGLRQSGVEVISCPTCGRLDVDLFKIVSDLEVNVKQIKKNIRLAVLGCAVNGPGEAKEADIGIACGKGEAILYKRGNIVRKIRENEIVKEILKEIEEFNNSNEV